jgi:hypothetical protein
MAIALNENGNFILNNGMLTQSQNSPWQNFEAESRCLQGTYPPNQLFGRNPISWELGNTGNKIDDITRIGFKYVVVQSVTFNRSTKVFKIT